MGLKNGDQILTVNGKEAAHFNKIPIDIIMSEASEVEILREGVVQKIQIPKGFLSKLIKSQGTFVSPRIPFHVQEIMKSSPAAESGFQVNDYIVKVNGKSLRFYDEVKAEVYKNKGTNIEIVVYRNNAYKTLTANVSKEGTIGIFPYPPSTFLAYEHKDYSFLESIPAGIKKQAKRLQTMLTNSN
jgi:regulator of sigma E protease